MTFKDMDKYVERCQRNHNHVYYCCDAFEQAQDGGEPIRYLSTKDNNEYMTIDKYQEGWYLWSNEYMIEYDKPLKHCPWCGVRLDKSYERLAGKA